MSEKAPLVSSDEAEVPVPSIKEQIIKRRELLSVLLIIAALVIVCVTLVLCVTLVPEPGKSNYWIDSDIGADDVICISMLFQSSITSSRIRGISTVFGNAHAVNATRNTHRYLDAINRTLSVAVATGTDYHYPGGHLFPADWMVASDNLTGISLPPPLPSYHDVDSVTALVAAAASTPNLQIVAIGPLTNLALALSTDANFAAHVSRVVIMGGAVFVPGNVPNNVSEWNIYGDPIAADAVFRAFGDKIVLVPLDVIYPIACTVAMETQVCTHPQPPAVMRVMCEAVTTACLWGSDSLADPVAGAYVLNPDLFVVRTLPIKVVTSGPNAGQTVVDEANGTPIRVATTVEAADVVALIDRM